MRSSTGLKHRKYVKGYGFLLSFVKTLENSVINMEKKLTDTATETGIDAAKAASKSVVQKTAEQLEI